MSGDGKCNVVHLFGPVTKGGVDCAQPKQELNTKALILKALAGRGENDSSDLTFKAQVLLKILEVDEHLRSLQGRHRNEANVRLRVDGIRGNDFQTNASILMGSHQLQWTRSPSYFRALTDVLSEQLKSRRRDR